MCQFYGGPSPWGKAYAEAANRFFKAKIDNSGADAYKGRTGSKRALTIQRA